MQKINCPNCQHLIDVKDVLSHEVHEKLEAEYTKKNEELFQEVKGEKQKIQEEKAEFYKEKEKYDLRIEEAVRSQLKEEKPELEKRIGAQISEEQSVKVRLLEDEIKEKSEEIKAARGLEAENLKLKREKEVLRDEIEIEIARENSQTLNEERVNIKKSEQERADIAIAEKDLIIEQLEGL